VSITPTFFTAKSFFSTCVVIKYAMVWSRTPSVRLQWIWRVEYASRSSLVPRSVWKKNDYIFLTSICISYFRMSMYMECMNPMNTTTTAKQDWEIWVSSQLIVCLGTSSSLPHPFTLSPPHPLTPSPPHPLTLSISQVTNRLFPYVIVVIFLSTQVLRLVLGKTTTVSDSDLSALKNVTITHIGVCRFPSQCFVDPSLSHSLSLACLLKLAHADIKSNQ
jgi:hypothetical protein